MPNIVIDALDQLDKCWVSHIERPIFYFSVSTTQLITLGEDKVCRDDDNNNKAFCIYYFIVPNL